MGASFQLTGLRGFEAGLEKASAELRTLVGNANRDTAYAIQARAHALAPKDRGDLGRAIAVQGKGMNWRVWLLHLTLSGRGGRNRAHLNPSVYGVWYEYGFVTRKIAAHPFMRPAVDAETPHYEATMAGIA